MSYASSAWTTYLWVVSTVSTHARRVLIKLWHYNRCPPKCPPLSTSGHQYSNILVISTYYMSPPQVSTLSTRKPLFLPFVGKVDTPRGCPPFPKGKGPVDSGHGCRACIPNQP